MPRLSAAAAACVSWAALLCALAHADGAESRPPRAAPLLHLPPGAAPRRGAAEPPALPPAGRLRAAGAAPRRAPPAEPRGPDRKSVV